MYYIVFDLEFNQDFTCDLNNGNTKAYYPYEIIQIGAVKLDSDLNTAAEFNRFIKPVIYSQVSPFITELTGITTEQLVQEETLYKVYLAFLDFIGTSDAVLCSWGRVDIKELHRSLEHFQLDISKLPKQFIDLQPYASLHLNQPKKKQLRLNYTVEALGLPMPYSFHNAIQDAYYTAEILKKIMNPFIKPELYDPADININTRTKQPKKIIDFDTLIKQFEKMYDRPMTEEEQKIIITAYQMGKTGQFIKYETPKEG